MNKMVINHLEKLFVTNDAATIIRELEVEHPAAKEASIIHQESSSNYQQHMSQSRMYAWPEDWATTTFWKLNVIEDETRIITFSLQIYFFILL